MEQRKICVDREAGFTFEYWPVNSAVMEFNVYDIAAQSIDGSEIEYLEKGWNCGTDWTTDLSKAAALFSGTIKFDGCINVIFADQENCMPHFCGNPADRFKMIFDRLYEFAAELMPENKEFLI